MARFPRAINRYVEEELVCRCDFLLCVCCYCSRHCKTSPVVLEGFGSQVWPNPKMGRKSARQFPARLQVPSQGGGVRGGTD